jgi:hypothetical protein
MGVALLGVSLGLLPARHAEGAGFSYKAVAFLDTKAPGGGKLVNDFEPGAMSDQGEVAFVVDYEPPDSDGEGLYLASQGQLIPIEEPNRPAVTGWTFVPDGPIDQIVSPVGMNANGDVSFGSDIQKAGDSEIRTGAFLWIRKTGTLVPIGLPDEQAPRGGKFGTIPGHTWTDVNDLDDVAFSVMVPDATGNEEQGVFVQKADGNLRAVARPGDKLADGATLTRARRPNINNAGTVVFEGRIDRGDATGIYMVGADNKVVAVAAPDTALPGGGKLQEVQNGRLNNKGEVAFLGRTDAGWGVYKMADGKITAVATPGADLREGAKLDTVTAKDGSLALSDSGDVAMQVELDGNAGHAVYLFHGGQLEAVAREGMDLPGVGAVDNDASEHVALNSQGQVAFQAKLKDGRTALVVATPIP